MILVRRETNPDDLRGMVAARGILTSRGGKTSHAAVVARGMGRTCVCGADSLRIDAKKKTLTTQDGTEVAEGDPISIDGTTGEVFAGEVPVSTRWSSATSRATTTSPATSWWPRSRGSWSTPTGAGGSRSGPTPTPPTTPRAPAGSGRRASGCAAPSTCSSASGRRWSRR